MQTLLQPAVMALSAAIADAAVFIIFKKYLAGRQDAAMKFLLINLPKDLLWCVAWLLILERNRTNFLWLVLIFIIASFFLYRAVVRLINKS